MRRAIRNNRQRGPSARGVSMPAPTGGWNDRDPLHSMPPTDAVILDNWFPTPENVRLRNGYESFATGMTSDVESLMTYSAGASDELFAANNGNIYDITSGGAVGAAAVSGLTGNKWQYVNMTTAGGSFLICVNGEDSPRHYNGTSWSTPTMSGTGLTTSNLNNVALFKGRLMFTESGTLSFWYYAVDTISGALTEFNLGNIFKEGGELISIGTWSRDAGDGPDDFAVFITSKGEVAIYQGTDPSSASAWSLVGVYAIGTPLGKRCMANLGSDLIILTDEGFFPISVIIAQNRAAPSASMSQKIVNTVNQVAKSRKSADGWQPIYYPRGQMFIVNVPFAGNEYQQYVMNSFTGAWCRFTGQNAVCWGLSDDLLYFGGDDGVVYKADIGRSDAGANIEGDGLQAFSYMGSSGRKKRVTMVRPVLFSDNQLEAGLVICTDYQTTAPTAVVDLSNAPTAVWDVALWDVTPWADSLRLVDRWYVGDGIGYTMALRITLDTAASQVVWISTDYMLEDGAFV